MAAPVWEDVGTTFTERCVFMDIIGPTGTGRSSLALSAPGPIAIIHANEKLQGLKQRVVVGGKKIREHKFGFIPSNNADVNKQKAGVVYAGIRAHYFDAIDNWARTCVFDTGNEVWSTLRYATFGVETPKANRIDAVWGGINKEMRGFWTDKYKSQDRCNLVTVHQAGNKWIDKLKDGVLRSVETDIVERKGGFKEVPFMADVIVQTWRGNDLSFNATIIKGWFNAAVEGLPLNDGFLQSCGYSGLNFASIMAMITDTPESEWTK